MSDLPRAVRMVRREQRSALRMIGAWPAGIRFEDAEVPTEGWFKGRDRDLPAIWPESSLSVVGHIGGRRR
jgi:hypothetical protein